MARGAVLLVGLGLLGFLLLPSSGRAEEPKPERDPRWNGTYDKLRDAPHDHQECGCRPQLDEEPQESGGLHWVWNSGVDWRSQRINRFRSRHGTVLWQARAFPGRVGRIHGFHGRRGHGRRW
jgi:hypothetical protein